MVKGLSGQKAWSVVCSTLCRSKEGKEVRHANLQTKYFELKVLSAAMTEIGEHEYVVLISKKCYFTGSFSRGSVRFSYSFSVTVTRACIN